MIDFVEVFGFLVIFWAKKCPQRPKMDRNLVTFWPSYTLKQHISNKNAPKRGPKIGSRTPKCRIFVIFTLWGATKMSFLAFFDVFGQNGQNCKNRAKSTMLCTFLIFVKMSRARFFRNFQKSPIFRKIQK